MSLGTARLVVLAVVAVLALAGAGSARTNEARARDAGTKNQLLWLKRSVGICMLLLAAIYAYLVYASYKTDWSLMVLEDDAASAVRGVGWLLLGGGLVTRIKVADSTVIQTIDTAWSNSRRSFGIGVGFLCIAIHTGYLIDQFGARGLAVDYNFAATSVRVATEGVSASPSHATPRSDRVAPR